MTYTGLTRLGPQDINAFHRSVGAVNPTCHHHRWNDIDALANRVQSFVSGEAFYLLLRSSLKKCGIESCDNSDFFIDKRLTVHLTGATIDVDIEGISSHAGAVSLSLLADDGLNIHTSTHELENQIKARSQRDREIPIKCLNDTKYRLPHLIPFMKSVDDLFGPGQNIKTSFGPSATPIARHHKVKGTVEEIQRGSSPEIAPALPSEELKKLEQQIAQLTQKYTQEQARSKRKQNRYDSLLVNLKSANSQRLEAEEKLKEVQAELRKSQAAHRGAERRLKGLQAENEELVTENAEMQAELMSSSEVTNVQAPPSNVQEIHVQAAPMEQLAPESAVKASTQANFNKSAQDSLELLEELCLQLKEAKEDLLRAQNNYSKEEKRSHELEESLNKLEQEMLQLSKAPESVALPIDQSLTNMQSPTDDSALLADLKSRQDEILKLKEALNASSQSQEALKTSLKAKENEIASLKENLTSNAKVIEGHLTEMNSLKEAHIKELASQRVSLENEAIDFAQTALSAENKAKALEEQLAEAKSELERLLSNQNASASKDLLNQIEINSAQSQKIIDLQAALDGYIGKTVLTEDQEKALLELHNNYQSLQTKLSAAKEDTAQAQKSEKAANAKLKELSQALEDQSALKNALSTAQEKLKKLTNQFTEAQSEYAEFKEAKNEKIEQLQFLIDSLEEKASEHEEQATSAAKELQKAQSEAKSLNQKTQALESALTAAQAENKILTSKSQTSIQGLKDEIAQLKEAESTHNERIQELSDLADQEKAAAQSARANLNDANRQIEDLEAQLVSAKAEYKANLEKAQSQAKVQFLRRDQTIEDLQTELRSLSNEYAIELGKAHETNEAQKHCINELVTQLEDAQDALSGKLQHSLKISTVDLESLTPTKRLLLLQSAFERARISYEESLENAERNALLKLTNALPEEIKSSLMDHIQSQ